MAARHCKVVSLTGWDGSGLGVSGLMSSGGTLVPSMAIPWIAVCRTRKEVSLSGLDLVLQCPKARGAFGCVFPGTSGEASAIRTGIASLRISHETGSLARI